VRSSVELGFGDRVRAGRHFEQERPLSLRTVASTCFRATVEQSAFAVVLLSHNYNLDDNIEETHDKRTFPPLTFDAATPIVVYPLFVSTLYTWQRDTEYPDSPHL
jgi:hypothetical protein